MRGQADSYRPKSLGTVMGINLVHLLTLGIFYLSNYSVHKSRHEIDPKNRDLSIRRHRIFVGAWTSFLYYTLLGIQVLYSYINMAGLGIFPDMKYMMGLTLVFSFLVLGGSIYLSLKLGQGGDRLKIEGEEASSSSYTMEDDHLWKLGNTIYYNRDDPANFVEKRMGVGFTMNMGRPLGKIIFLVTVLGLVFLIYQGLVGGLDF